MNKSKFKLFFSLFKESKINKMTIFIMMSMIKNQYQIHLTFTAKTTKTTQIVPMMAHNCLSNKIRQQTPIVHQSLIPV